jgi:two-component system nitrogen regulation sensor histidine kinase NtrY
MSLRFKFIIINFIIIIVTVIPLVMFTLRTTEFKLEIKNIPEIEDAIENAVIHTPDKVEKEKAIEALRKYRQMTAVKLPLKREFITFTILLSMFIIIFSTALTILVTVRVTTPLRKLEEAARGLSRGDYIQITGVRTKDEVGSLVNTFNTMSASLEESRKKLRIAEREAAWKNAARAVAHEIRNPLTPIRLATERLREKASSGKIKDEEIVMNTTGMILEEIENLDSIARSFSEFAKLPEPRKRMDDVNEIIKEVKFLYSEYEGIEIICELEGGMKKIPIDRERIKQVLINIVKNSIEAMEESGKIEITSVINAQQDSVEISIKDNGKGLSVDPSLLFVPHFTTKKKGSGLGLAISKRIIEAHDGKITISSKKGEGTEFTITLPTGD